MTCMQMTSDTHTSEDTHSHMHALALMLTQHICRYLQMQGTHMHTHTHTHPRSAFVWSLGMECINVSLCEWHRATQLLCLLSYMTQCHSYVAVSNGEL